MPRSGRGASAHVDAVAEHHCTTTRRWFRPHVGSAQVLDGQHAAAAPDGSPRSPHSPSWPTDGHLRCRYRQSTWSPRSKGMALAVRCEVVGRASTARSAAIGAEEPRASVAACSRSSSRCAALPSSAGQAWQGQRRVTASLARHEAHAGRVEEHLSSSPTSAWLRRGHRRRGRRPTDCRHRPEVSSARLRGRPAARRRRWPDGSRPAAAGRGIAASRDRLIRKRPTNRRRRVGSPAPTIAESVGARATSRKDTPEGVSARHPRPPLSA
jgi:hypothetical protein